MIILKNFINSFQIKLILCIILLFFFESELFAKDDFYKILEVDKSASEQTIKRQYKKLALRYHPDRIKKYLGEDFTKEDVELYEKKYKQINEANRVLSDPQKKAEYDREIFNYYANSIRENEIDFYSAHEPEAESIASILSKLVKNGSNEHSIEYKEALEESYIILDKIYYKIKYNIELTENDFNLILNEIANPKKDTSFRLRLNAILVKIDPWPQDIWNYIEKNFELLRAGAPLFRLVDAINEKKYWPPNFAARVESLIANNFENKSIIPVNDLIKLNNLRISAFLLLLNRENSPIDQMTYEVESYLSSHYRSDLFKHGLFLIVNDKRLKSDKIDNLLLEAIKSELVIYPDNKNYGIFNSRSIFDIFFEREKIPEEIWEIISEKLTDKIKNKEVILQMLDTIIFLTQKHDAPEIITESLFSILALDSDILIRFLSEFLNYDKDRNNYNKRSIKVSNAERLQHLTCLGLNCNRELIKIIQDFTCGSISRIKGSKDIRLELVKKLTSSLETDNELMQDLDFKTELHELLDNERRFGNKDILVIKELESAISQFEEKIITSEIQNEEPKLSQELKLNPIESPEIAIPTKVKKTNFINYTQDIFAKIKKSFSKNSCSALFKK